LANRRNLGGARSELRQNQRPAPILFRGDSANHAANEEGLSQATEKYFAAL
jgi:hypothetical protein